MNVNVYTYPTVELLLLRGFPVNVKTQVKRGMKAADARKLCPELSLVQVPTRHGKADISLYRCVRSYIFSRAGELYGLKLLL